MFLFAENCWGESRNNMHAFRELTLTKSGDGCRVSSGAGMSRMMASVALVPSSMIPAWSLVSRGAEIATIAHENRYNCA